MEKHLVENVIVLTVSALLPSSEGFGSWASRPVSPAPSVLSFTTDVLHRRPLISPARLVLRPSEPSPEAGGWAPTQSCNGAGSQARVSSKVERGSQAGTGTRGARDLDGWSASPWSYGRNDESDDEVRRSPTPGLSNSTFHHHSHTCHQQQQQQQQKHVASYSAS